MENMKYVQKHMTLGLYDFTEKVMMRGSHIIINEGYESVTVDPVVKRKTFTQQLELKILIEENGDVSFISLLPEGIIIPLKINANDYTNTPSNIIRINMYRKLFKQKNLIHREIYYKVREQINKKGKRK